MLPCWLVMMRKLPLILHTQGKVSTVAICVEEELEYIRCVECV